LHETSGHKAAFFYFHPALIFRPGIMKLLSSNFVQNTKKMNVLYLSYDGMTDPLGQSQVIPYLSGLSAAGHSITIISFDKKNRYNENKDLINRVLNAAGMQWISLSYTKKPPVLATLWDVWRLRRKASSMIRKKSFGVIHCRSYITALVGLSLKLKFNIRFIFDMRGFWADERVEGNLWNLSNPVYRLVYRYFKNKEQQFLRTADAVISLTENAKEVIREWKPRGEDIVPVTVIPCCADLDHFSFKNILPEKRLNWKNKLRIGDGDFILGYLGAIGTWYLLDEMLDFFICLKAARPAAKFLIVTMEPPGIITDAMAKKNIDPENVIITSSSRNDLPSLLSLFRISVFFIKPSFSKKASSPTKQGELMGMGIPVICNSGIGDSDRIIRATGAGIIITELNNEAYRKALESVDDLMHLKPEFIAAGAEKYYSLSSGISSYKEVYRKLEGE
jgi:glycosyltransferase involved in cell wall biosynthesis